MTTLLNRFKKPLRFALALVPIAIVGGYFTGVYGWTELTDDVKSQSLVQIGNNLSLYYLITTMQAMIYALIFGFFGYILSDKIGLMKPLRFEKKPTMVTIGMTLLTGLLLCTDLFYFRNFLPQGSNPSHGRHYCSQYPCCASLCGRTSAIYHADVRRNNTNDPAAMLSPERCRWCSLWVSVSQIWHSVCHDGTRRGTYRMEDHLDHFDMREIWSKNTVQIQHPVCRDEKSSIQPRTKSCKGIGMTYTKAIGNESIK